MTRRPKQRNPQADNPRPPRPCVPVNLIDGIPDVSRRSRWKYVVLAVVFLAWAAFLVYCGLAGGL